MSSITQHTITVGTTEHLITVTSQRTENDINGNPQSLIQIWVMNDSNDGNIWYPKLKAYRERKDSSYKVQESSRTIQHTVKSFVKYFEKELNNRP